MRWLVVLAVCCAITDAASVKFKDCGSKYGLVHTINIFPCSKDPCQLTLGSTVNFTVQFMSKAPSNGVYIELTASADGQYPEPAPLPDYNGCDMGVKCPVKAGDVNTLGSSIYLEEDFPTSDVALTLEIQNDDLSDIICAQFNVTLVDGMRAPLSHDNARHENKHHGRRLIKIIERVVKEEAVMKNGDVVEKERFVKEKDVLRFRPRP